MFEKPQHSRQAFGEAETKRKLFEEERKKKGTISRILLDLGDMFRPFIDPKHESQADIAVKLHELKKQAHAEAEELNKRYELLRGRVVEAKSNLEKSLRDLADFERDELGIKEEKAA